MAKAKIRNIEDSTQIKKENKNTNHRKNSLAGYALKKASAGEQLRRVYEY